MALGAAKNGIATFVVSPDAITPRDEILFRCNRDSGTHYIASMPENVYRLDQIQPGNALTITTANKGISSVTRIIPHERDAICYAGHFIRGSVLASVGAVTGDYIKLA